MQLFDVRLIYDISDILCAPESISQISFAASDCRRSFRFAGVVVVNLLKLSSQSD